MYVLILVIGYGIRASGVAVPGFYDWEACQSAGKVAIADEHQNYAASGFLCVPGPPTGA